MIDVLGLAAVSFVAGGLSIATPCCLPLLPGYLSYVAGVARTEEAPRRRVAGAALLFVAGFAIVFTALGATASLLGAFLLPRLPLFVKVAGAFVIVMGLATLGVLRMPFLYREKRLDLSRIRSGPAGALPLGMAFAFGWTPCIGPVLGAVLTMAAATQTAGKGAFLLLVYSAGMGIPLLLFALGYARASRTLGFLRRHGRAVEQAGGVMLVAMGVLLVSGWWQRLFTPMIRWLTDRGWPPV